MEFKNFNFSIFTLIFFIILSFFINLYQQEWLNGGIFFILFAIVGYIYKLINKLKKSYLNIQNELKNLNYQKETFFNQIDNFNGEYFNDNNLTKEYSYAINKINGVIDKLKEEILNKKPKVKTIQDNKKIKELKDKLLNVKSNTLENDLNLKVEINENFEELGEKCDENENLIIQLNEKIDTINSTLNLIEEISSQSELLALNATIESARFGEEGKGFEIVADEMKKLSTKTEQTTKDIKSIINFLHQEINLIYLNTKELNEKIENSQNELKNSFENLKEKEIFINKKLNTFKQNLNSIIEEI